MTEQDPVLAARHKFEASLQDLPGWQLVMPVAYENDRTLYKTVLEAWSKNWDATDPRYYHVTSSETLLLHRWEEFDALAHLFFFGPHDSGKNQALEIFQRLSPNPLLVEGPSVNSLYQTISICHPTLLMDETDRLGIVKEQSDYVQAMLQILNVYKKGAVTLRGTREGIPQIFDLFCPKILAGQKKLPGSLPDRTIRIDCERNVKDIPLDLDIPDTLRGQLEKYGAGPHENKCISKEQFRTTVGDNRITQLYYPLYSVCPDPLGQKAILDLAVEDLNDRRHIDSYGPLSEIMEAIAARIEAITGDAVGAVVADVSRDKEKWEIDLGDLAKDCESLVPKAKDASRWIGWRLNDIGIPRHREKTGRFATITHKLLAKKLRRYAPGLLSPTTTTTTPTTPLED